MHSASPEATHGPRGTRTPPVGWRGEEGGMSSGDRMGPGGVNGGERGLALEGVGIEGDVREQGAAFEMQISRYDGR
jgi:hypothetical protein